MAFLIFFFIVSCLAIGCSIPAALANHMSISQIFYDYSSCLVFIGVVCGLLLLIFRFVFKHAFNPNCKLFYVSNKEVKFYEKTKMRIWKKFVPDLGFLVGFKKKVLSGRTNSSSNFYYKFLYENVNAAYLHFFTFLLSPLFFIFLHKIFYLSIGIPCMLISFVFNMLPAMLQRYLRPRVLKLYNRALKKEEMAQTNLQTETVLA